MSEVSESHAVKGPTLHHINLKTRHLQKMIDWYATVVSMKSTFPFPGGAWLTNDAANHRLALLTSPQLIEDPDKLMHAGMHHSAFEYATFDELLDTYVRLTDMPIDPAQLVATRKAGTSFAEIHQRAYAGEFKPAGPLDLRVPLGDPCAPL